MIILSFSDLWQSLKSGWKCLLYSALFFGFCALGYALLKPVTFTAHGIFKGGNQGGSNSLTKALELIGGGESYSETVDPKIFLRCYPVMEQVVRTLNLQLSLSEEKQEGFFQKIGAILKAERAQRVVKKRSIPAQVLMVPVLSKPILKSPEPSIDCIDLNYPDILSRDYQLTFCDSNHFEMWEKGKSIGKGVLGSVFEWEEGSFTLEAKKEVSGKSFHLSLIPLSAAAESLGKRIQVQRSKDHPSLVEISFKHSNPHLAMKIVNATMEAFQHYLKEEGKRKIAQQLGYLQQRQEESLVSMERTMESHKAYLESHLDEGGMFSLEDELTFMNERQAALQEEQSKIANEMQALAPPLSFPLIEAHLKANKLSMTSSLSEEGTKLLMNEYEHSLDLLRVEQEHYTYCLKILEESNFDASALVKIIDDPTLRGRFDKVHALHHRLIDEKNWMAKERELLRQELETERVFLIKHLKDLKEVASLKEKVLEERLRHIKEARLHLLYDRYQKNQESLTHLSAKASFFPQKWFTEKKIELNTKLHIELIDSITKMIEAKNISYHLDFLSSAPLRLASLPLIPNPPHLFFQWTIGSIFGALFVFFVLSFREIIQGPSASVANLRSEGKAALPFSYSLEDLKEICYCLKNESGPIAIFAKEDFIARNLSLLLPENQEILFSSAPLKSLIAREIIDRASHLVILLKEERLKNLPSLSKKTLFLVESGRKRAYSLAEILPILEKFTSFAFWRSPPKQNSQEHQQTENYSILDI